MYYIFHRSHSVLVVHNPLAFQHYLIAAIDLLAIHMEWRIQICFIYSL